MALSGFHFGDHFRTSPRIKQPPPKHRRHKQRTRRQQECRNVAKAVGNKALLRPTDQVKGRPDLIVENQGAEYGILKWKDGDALKLGEKVELYCTNLDM